jgi:hypothetical protein
MTPTRVPVTWNKKMSTRYFNFVIFILFIFQIKLMAKTLPTRGTRKLARTVMALVIRLMAKWWVISRHWSGPRQPRLVVACLWYLVTTVA